METHLRKCPFCGTTNVLLTVNGIRCDRCINLDGYANAVKKMWNNAWCWKEIDRLKAFLGEAGEAAKAGLEWSMEPLDDESFWSKDFKEYVGETRKTLAKIEKEMKP